MFNILNDYIATKTAAAAARKVANTAIATDGAHTLPEACDHEAIHKAFTSLARSNKNAKAVVDGIDGAKIYADAEVKRAEKRALKMKAEHDALENAINSRLDEIMADDSRRALLIAEANAAAEMAAQSAQPGDVREEWVSEWVKAHQDVLRDAMRQRTAEANAAAEMAAQSAQSAEAQAAENVA